MKNTILLLAAFALTGCAKQTIIFNGGGDVATQSSMQIFFIGGIGQEQTLDAAQVCGGAEKVAKVSTSQSFIDGLIAGVTGSIVTPRSIEVYCTK